MVKKIVLITFSVIFLATSAFIIGWIVKKEIDKGAKETVAEERSLNEENGIIKNKEDAKNSLDSIDETISSLEKDDFTSK